MFENRLQLSNDELYGKCAFFLGEKVIQIARRVQKSADVYQIRPLLRIYSITI
jgi:hypothetical protein